MDMSENIDLKNISTECKIATDSDSSITIELIENLKHAFSDIQLIAIYNYLLQIETRTQVLLYLLKEVNRLRDSSSLEVVTDLLLMKERENREDYTNVRVMCTKVISNFKDHRSVFPLLYCLNNKDENYKVRLSCADALGRLGDRYAVVSLIDVMSDEEEKSIYIRESAASALGMLGDVRAAESLLGILETRPGLMDRFTYLKERVVEALGKLNFLNERTFKALKNALSDENPQVRINAIEALMHFNNPESVNLIRGMLFDRHDDVARNAVVALYNTCGIAAMHEILSSPKMSSACKDEAKKVMEEVGYG